MTDSAPYSVPRDPGRWRAIGLAAVVHAALLALLWFGVSWRNETPVAVEAEVWSTQAREAAPRALPEPLPEAPARPAPVVRKIVKPPEPEALTENPQIALEQQKKLKLQAQREQEQELKKAQKQQQAADQARQDQQDRVDKLAQQKAQQKRDDQLKSQQQANTAKANAAAAAEQKKLASENQRKELLEAQKLNASRDEQLAQLRRAAGTPSTSTGTDTGTGGDAPKSQGSRGDASYIDRVRQKIKSNTIFNGADQLSSNPAVEFAVDLLPDGSARRLRKTKSSGVPGFDEAVERAIEKSQPFPPDKSGAAPSGFTVSYKPKDQ